VGIEEKAQVLDTDVVIVGAGPVGSALAVDLAVAGTRAIALEARAPAEPPHPGTNLTNVRSMEHFRRWGVTPFVHATNPVGPDVRRDVQFVTRGNGYMVTNRVGVLEFSGTLPFSSAAPHFGPQQSIEEGLRARLASLECCEVRFSSTFERYVEHDDHVETIYRDADGVEHSLRSRYVVGADGSRSLVRRQLGIRMEGTPRIQHASIWYLQTPQAVEILERRFGSKAAMVWFANEDEGGGIIVLQNGSGHIQYYEALENEDDDGDDWEMIHARLCRNIGAPVDAEVLEGGNLWLHSLVAPKFSAGRVFLAGESAHLISAFGGFGMNTGIGDAADLGWKLTAAVEGWAGDGLLESYSVERVPVVEWIRDLTEESTQHQGTALALSGIEDEGPAGDAIRASAGERIVALKDNELASFGAQFGAAYRNSPIVVADGTEPPPASFGDFTPSTSPGARLPHVWLGDDHSLYDEIANRGFTLLQIDPDADVAGLEQAAASRGVPLNVVALGDHDLNASYEAGLILVRPDHHVAWRGKLAPSDPDAIIEKVRGGAVPTGHQEHSRLNREARPATAVPSSPLANRGG
jgi:2-polyprenyl-6-methoxyphenol hydroxylase-like FAD-dependent oxidoreductase